MENYKKVVAVAFYWEQSPVFFSKFSEGSARERARNEALRITPSATCMVICVSCVSLDGLRKKGRLLVAYGRLREVSNY